MKRALSKAILGATAMALLITNGALAAPPTSDYPSTEVFIREGGHVSVHEHSGQKWVVLSDDLQVHNAACPASVAPANGVFVFGDPQAHYVDFMRVANWLEDCKVHSLYVTERVAGASVADGSADAVDLEIGAAPPPIPCSPPTTRGGPPNCRTRKSPVLISLNQDGPIVLFSGHEEKPTNLGNLSGDLATLAPDATKEQELLVRADFSVTYRQFVQLLNELNLDGYRRLGLINENL